MIKSLRGTVSDIGPNFIIVDVVGVGHQVFTNAPLSYLIGTPTLVHTHLAVRENALDLYGFADRDTLHIFELLIELPKIGPKSALQILTQADISLLQEAVMNQDPAYLSKVSGIGKKSAEKIVAGLKDKLEIAPAMADQSPGSPAASSLATDTIDALMSLGYPAPDARRVVLEIMAEGCDGVSASDIIKISLQRLHIHI